LFSCFASTKKGCCAQTQQPTNGLIPSSIGSASAGGVRPLSVMRPLSGAIFTLFISFRLSRHATPHPRLSARLHILRAGGIHANARPHRTGESNALDIGALRAARLGGFDCLHQCGDVLVDLAWAEADLADGHVQQASLVVAELDTAAAHLADRAR